MSTSQRVLMVIAPEGFRDEELSVPRDLFKAEGWQVDTVSTKICSASGMLGALEAVTQTLNHIDPLNYDAVVVVGGMGSPAHLWNDVTLHQTLQSVEANGKVIAAICLSGAVLAKAGLLQRKRATVWEMPESIEALTQNGAEYTGEPVTVDGRIVTANGPDAAEAFGKTVIERVKALIPTA